MMKTKVQQFVLVSLLAGMFTVNSFATSPQASDHFYRTNFDSFSPLQNPVLTNIPGAMPVMLQALATPAAALSVPLVSTTNVVTSGTFWTMHSAVPLPGNFFPNLPVYLLDATNRIFLIDDRSVDYAALLARQAAFEATNGTSDTLFALHSQLIDSNRLWLSVPTNALPGANVFNVVIHETIPGKYYDVLTKTDLMAPHWTLENTVSATNAITRAALWRDGRTNLFVWARVSANPIYQQPWSQWSAIGDTVTFSVGVAGAGVSYQWTCNGTNIYGATGSSYTINNVTFEDEGDYACLITTAAGTVVSQSAQLSVFYGWGQYNEIMVVGDRQDYTFRGGIYYTVPYPVRLSGKTTFEGGAIIGFISNGEYPTLQILGTVDCQGGPYNPTELGFWNNGLSSGLTDVPYVDLTYAGNVSLHDFRFSAAAIAIAAPRQARLDLWNCQFSQCQTCVLNGRGSTASFHNVLLAGCGFAVNADTNAFSVEMEQVTADVNNVWPALVQPQRVALTNSLLWGNGGTATTDAEQNVAWSPDVTNFATSGGVYYLAADSPLRVAGTTNFSARLRQEFRRKTTAAPLALPAGLILSGSLTLSPQVSRYAGGPPDLGYHFDAVDYTAAALNNAGEITVTPGTVLGFREEFVPQHGWSLMGIYAWQNSRLVSHGLPDRPIVFTDMDRVQAQADGNCAALLVPDFEAGPTAVAPVLDMRFCELYSGQGAYQVIGGINERGNRAASYNSLVNWTLADCVLHGGKVVLGPPITGYNFRGSGMVQWRNNLFDRVLFSLMPSALADETRIDLSVEARNNLFRGKGSFFVQARTTNAPPWIFTDNLFDQVEFWQDADWPVQADHNAYRPWSQPRWSNTEWHLLDGNSGSGGVGDVTLNYNLPHTNGPFGNYYLTTLTPLWQGGSRTAEEAGLAHYTTFANQFKDASNQPVNIGLHYVTATNSQPSTFNSQPPLDSDGDGVADYVEAEYGTDWLNPMTDNETPDALNAAYDDVDLSGNGLVGRIKKALGLNPLCLTNPLTLKQIITGEEPDIATFEVPVSYDAVASSGALNVNMNGIDVTLEDCTRATNGNCLLAFNVDFDPAGLHYLSAGFRLGNEPPAELHPVMTASGVLQPFVSSNSVQFFESGSMFDDTSAYLDAKVFLPEADYKIELYNPDTTPPTLLATITNSTTDGMIQEEWDLTCADNSHYAGGKISAAYTVTPSGGNNSGNVPVPQPKKILTRATGSLSEWGPNFDMVFFYTPTNGSMSSAYAKNGAVWNGMQGVVDTLIREQSDYSVYKSDFNRYLPDSNGEYPGYISSWEQVTNKLLPDIANGVTKQIYMHGHGSKNGWIGSWDESAYVTATDVSDVLGNGYSISNSLIVGNPYRFVFLDGCSTAYNLDWCHAFGIFSLSETEPAARNKTGPQAFVGWADIHSGWLSGGTTDSFRNDNVAKAYAQTLNNFYSMWMRGFTLKECIDKASRTGSGIAPFPVPKYKNKTVVIQVNGQTYPYKVLTSDIFVVGYSGLKVDGVNHSFDKYYSAPKNK